MFESRSLPQFGQSDKGHLTGSRNGAGGNQCSDVHVGVLTATVHDRESGAIPDLCADGKNGSWLVLGFRAFWNRIMANRYGSSRIVSAETDRNRRSHILLVPAVPEFSINAAVASWRDGIRNLDSARNVDAVSHSKMLMPFSLLVKLIPVAGVVGAMLAFIEGSGTGTSFLFGAAGSGTVLAAIGFARWLIERRDKLRADSAALSRTDSQFSLEREKLLDAQVVALMKQTEEFYSVRDKENRGVIEMQRAMLEQKDKMIEQLQTLATAQAAQLQKGK